MCRPFLQGLNDMTNAVKFYKDVLHHDNTHIEAIACIANFHFYTDQPEIALRYYRLVSVWGVVFEAHFYQILINWILNLTILFSHWIVLAVMVNDTNINAI